MQNEYDYWSKIKKHIESSNDVLNKYPKEKEVWMSSLGRNIGFEQNGSGDSFFRPVLVIKKFNNHMFWVVPLSTKQKDIDFYFNYTDPNNQKVSALLAQIRLFSIKRFNRKMYDMSDSIFTEVQGWLRSFLR